MAIAVRSRTLRPSTRKPSSIYKINTEDVGAKDTLRIEIDHEDNPGIILFLFELPGSEVANKDSIHFKANKIGSNWEITWLGSNPRRIT